MQSTHCYNLARLENVFEISIEKSINEKRKLKVELSKLKEFQDATTKVDGLLDGSFDNIFLLIEKVSLEIESKSEFIAYLRADLKETIINYFETHLKNVELCQELKDLAAMYDIVPSEHLPSLSEDRSSKHVTDLMEIQGWFEEDYKKFQQFSQELTASKQNLLKYKEDMIAADTPSLSEHIEHVNRDIFDVSASFDLVQQQLATLEELIKSEMMNYSKKFIAPSDVNRSILEIWQQHGIKYCDLVHVSTTSASENTSTQMANSSSQFIDQPKSSVQSMPVVVVESVENQEKQETVSESEADGTKLSTKLVELVANADNGNFLKNEETIDIDQLAQHFSEDHQNSLSSRYFAETLYTFVLPDDSNANVVKDIDTNFGGIHDNQFPKNDATIVTKELTHHISEENAQNVDIIQSTLSSIFFAEKLYEFVIPAESNENGEEINDEGNGEDAATRSEIDAKIDNQA